MLSHWCGTRNHCPDVSQPVHFIIIIPRDRYIIRLYFNPLQHASSVNLSKRTCVYNTQLIRTLFNFQEPHTSWTYLQSIQYNILLMEEIWLTSWGWYYSQGFIHPRWLFGVSSINSATKPCALLLLFPATEKTHLAFWEQLAATFRIKSNILACGFFVVSMSPGNDSMYKNCTNYLLNT